MQDDIMAADQEDSTWASFQDDEYRLLREDPGYLHFLTKLDTENTTRN